MKIRTIYDKSVRKIEVAGQDAECYNTSHRMKGGSESMSLVYAMCTKNGIAMAADRRSVKVANGIILLENDDTTKAFEFERFVVGTWGANEVARGRNCVPIKNVIADVMRGHENENAEFFLESVTSVIFSSAANRGSTYNFIVGRECDGRYRLSEYECADGALTLVGSFGENNTRACGQAKFVPDFFDVDGSATLSEMKDFCAKVVDAVIEYGQNFEKKGLISVFPVGGATDVVAFPN